MMKKLALLLLCVQRIEAQQAAAPVQPRPSREDTIIVTGTFSPVSDEDNSRSVTNIPIDEEMPPYLSPIDYLREDASVDLQQRGIDGIQTDLSIRGSSFGQTLVLLDGLRLNDSQTGHHNLDLPFPVEALSRIEVLNGAGSTVYGSDAVGGVVNFITEEPATSEVRLRAGFGNLGTNDQDVLATIRLGTLSERLAASRIFSTGFAPDRDFRSSAISSETWHRSRWGLGRFMIAGSDRSFGANQFYGPFPSWERTKGWLFGLNQSIGSAMTLSGGFRRHTDQFVLFRDNPEIYENNHVSDSWEFALRRKSEIRSFFLVSYGTEFDGDSISSSNLGSHGRNRTAPYLNLDLRYFHRISASAGVREEFFSGGRIESSPALSGAFWMKPTLKLISSFSTAFRLASYTDLYYQDPANIGNPFLSPERSWNFDVGAQWKPKQMISFKSTLFRRSDHNDIDYVKSIEADPWRAMNVQAITFVGFESSAELSRRSQHFNASYTVMTASQKQGQFLSKYVFDYPTHAVALVWHGQFKDLLALRSRINVVQRFQRDAYSLWDGGACITAGRIRPYFELSNIVGGKYQEIPRVDMPGRSFIGGLELLFGHPAH